MPRHRVCTHVYTGSAWLSWSGCRVPVGDLDPAYSALHCDWVAQDQAHQRPGGAGRESMPRMRAITRTDWQGTGDRGMCLDRAPHINRQEA